MYLLILLLMAFALFQISAITLILFWLDVYSFLLFQIVDLSPHFLPFIVGSMYIFLCFTLYSLQFSLCFVTELNHFCAILITSVFNSASDRLSISSLLSSFSGVLICSFIWAIFLCPGATVRL